MSKDNREMNIEEKFEKWIKDNAMNRLYMSDYFRAGYEVAQKEMQEKLDEAIEMIERIVDSQYRSDVSHFDVMNEAHEFLKARENENK